ncbi:hypothetical protein [Aquimarina agarivorans]|uniref:hypothetical protein n=1 Tax=Aquimarina agarivorans TaxID=980584 RepID=UPI0011101AEE|nr:hypothetical protein [Aquimarina agarivorans]
MRAVNDFKAMFPLVWKILNVGKSQNYKDFPILMQRMEAKCVLDFCAKRVARKFPDMLLITRHDSISTTESRFDSLKTEFSSLLNSYFEVEVKIGDEKW